MPVLDRSDQSPLEVVAKTPYDREVAGEGSRKMAPHMVTPRSRIKLVIESGDGISIEVPEVVTDGVFEILTELSMGNSVMLVPHHAVLTTQEAAGMLNVSRTYLMTLVKAGKIPSHKVGNRHRILAKDLMAYKRAEDEARQKVIAEMVRMSQEDGDDE